jgi:hypothetical protein
MAERLSTGRRKVLSRAVNRKRGLLTIPHKISVEFRPETPGDRKRPGVFNSKENLQIPDNGLKFRWADAISSDEWRIYKRAIRAVRDANIPFLLGGGFALATFTGRWRDTKDIDFYVMPQARQAAIQALKRAGFSDYIAIRAYDRGWIYRSVRSDVIVDIIWSMANRRARVDKTWFARAQPIMVRGEQVNVVPMEEFIWCKLYILQRDHCDWTDIFNLLYSSGPKVNWQHLIERLQNDTALLKAVLLVYCWLCPGRALQLPSALWQLLGLQTPPLDKQQFVRKRVRFLDSRGWFAALRPPNQKLQV